MWRLCVLALIATASAQIPSLGWCPDYQPMANFNMNRFLGTWYEAERYFTVSELGSRCVTTKYEQTPEGRILVSNEITNSLTGMKRVMDGHLQVIGREGEGRIIVKYSSLPVPYDNEFSILDTDYDNYAVMWSCSGIGPVHTQNAWVLTRDRLANMQIMQSAYGVLDRFKISRAFFVKTNQADCNVFPDPAADPIAAKSAVVDVVAKNVPEVAEKIEHIVEMSIIRQIAVFLCGFVMLRMCEAQVPFLGTCPDVGVMADFNPSRYLGKWYEAERYFAVFQLGGRCVTADYNERDNGVIGVVNKQLSSLTGIMSEIQGEAHQVSRSDEGKLSVRFPSLPFAFSAPYWVVDSDYDNYAIVWGCNDFGVFHTRNAWILTRSRNPELSVLEKAYTVLDKNNISRAYFIRTDQKNCPDNE
ncbi:uncharacterized protein LOC134756051 [Cydia strobilella]|uniref:uncharacterized protein LOC134756051 n=1 Tax=Cydia strobilella TaxID=1100964 RepID=UPI0030055B58